MMMEALDKAGLNAEHDVTHDVPGDAMKGDRYELMPEKYEKINFPRDYDGKLIKVLRDAVITMDTMPAGVKVIFMRRDQEEIEESFMASFGQYLNLSDRFQDRMDKIIRQIRNRRDVKTLDVFWYREVLEEQRKTFEKLQDNGWPVEVSRAARVIDPDKTRHKKEDMRELS